MGRVGLSMRRGLRSWAPTTGNGWKFLGVLFLFLFLFAAGCGGGGSDGSASGSSPSGPPGASLVIHSPNGLSMFYGEELRLYVTGGTPTYYWSLRSDGDQNWMRIDESRTAPDGSSTYLVASDYLWGVGPTRHVEVFVTDSENNWASLTITVTDMVPTVSPPKATVPLDIVPTPTMRFQVSGGTPPFYWTLDKPYLAHIVQDSSGESLLVQPLAAGRLTITLFDSKNLGASAVLDIVASRPKIVPGKATLSLGDTITLRASNGTPPYSDWHLSDPSVGVLSAPVGGWGDRTEAVFEARRLGITQVFLDDANGGQAVATVEVISYRALITPSEANLLPGDELLLTASYGLPPYHFFNGDPEVGELEEVSFNQVRFKARQEGITVIRLEDGRGGEDTCRILVSKAFQIYPLSIKGSPQETVVFFLYGGTPPYRVTVTDASLGEATIENGSEVHLTIAASQATEDTEYPGAIEVYDANGLRVTADVVVAGIGCPFQVEPTTATGQAGDTLRYLILCGTAPYQVTVMDATVVDVSSLSVNGNVVTLTVAQDAAEGTYADVIRIVDAQNRTLYAGVEVGATVTPLAVTPTSASGAPGDTLGFVVTGGEPPYTVQLTNDTVGIATVSGTSITVQVDASAPDGASSVLLIQDSAGSVVSASVTVSTGGGGT